LDEYCLVVSPQEKKAALLAAWSVVKYFKWCRFSGYEVYWQGDSIFVGSLVQNVALKGDFDIDIILLISWSEDCLYQAKYEYFTFIT